MLLFPWPDSAWALIVLVILSAPLIGTLWAPSMAHAVRRRGGARASPRASPSRCRNLGWSVGQTAGSAASARLADVTSDTVPYLLLSGLCLATFPSSPARAGRLPS